MPVTRGTDEKGSFYRWGEHGKKYRYTVGNVTGRNRAKARAARQGRAIYASIGNRARAAALRAAEEEKTRTQEGGFLEYVIPAINALPKLREGAPPVVREWIRKKGNLRITNVQVIRNPLTSKFKTILNWLTLGDFKRKIKQENYDDVFHLFMILRFQDGSSLRVDKNHVVEISTRVTGVSEKGGAVMNAGNPNCNLAEFFARGERVAGGPRPMWIYSAVAPRWNCQAFVSWCLQGSGLLTPSLNTFVNQDAEKLVSSGAIQKLLGGLTGLAGRLDVLLHGRGMRK